MRKLYSLTMSLLMDFIAIEGFRESTLEYNIKLLDKLRVRKLPDVFEKRSRITDGLLKSSKCDISYYENKLKHTSILNGHLLNTDEKSMIGRLQTELDDLIEYFLAGALLQYIRLGEWSKGMNKKFDLKFYNEVVNHLSSVNKKEITLASLYFNMLMLLDTEEEKYYTELINLRERFESRLSRMEEYNIAIVSMQYCYKKVLKGNSEYRRHQFNITKKILDKNLIPDGYIEPYFFTNTIRNASFIRELEWSEKFLKDYVHRLKPESSEEITEYSFAMIETAKGNFEKSLEHISKINIERSNMKLDIKNLQLVIYYELRYFEELISLIDTFRHYLQRDKAISDHIKKINMIFLNFVSDLIKINNNGKSKSAYLLKKEISKTTYFSWKDWLLKKTVELI